MTIEIFQEREDAEMQASEILQNAQITTKVIKVKIDQNQAPIYGFRYIGSKWEILDSFDEGFILLWPDWNETEAAECGLIIIRE